MKDPLLETPVLERTMAAVLDRHAREQPEKIALIEDGGRSLTYAELQKEAFRVAAGLAGLGVRRQEPVLVLMENSLDCALVAIGTGVAGVILAPINTAYKGDILRHVMRSSGARVAIVDAALCEPVAAVAADVPSLEMVIVRGEAQVAFPPPVRTVGFSTLLAVESTPPEQPGEVWDIAGLLFTSGTTGPSKGVRCPHGHAFSMASGPVPMNRDDVVLVALPLFHGAGLWNLTYGALRGGSTAVIQTAFSPTRFLDDVRRLGVTKTLLLGAMAAFLGGQPSQADDADNPLTTITVVPAPPNLDQFSTRFGVECVSSYGLTEAGVAFVTDPGDARPFVFGRPRPHIEVRLVDEHDIEVEPGQVGEIALRSTEPWAIMSGYHGLPDATLDLWRNLWLHTGDAAYRDETGNYVFVDRMKDALRRRGENVSSIEVEQALLVRPDIAEAAIVAVPSEYGEDEIKAALVLADGSAFDPEAILRDLVDRLPYFMVPRYFEAVDVLPKTMTHKVQKSALRQAGVTDTTWDCEKAGFRVTRSGLQEATR